MKKKIILFLFLIYNIQAQSQSFGYVNYGYIKSTGLRAPVGHDYNAYLMFNNNESSYIFGKDSLEGYEIQKPKIIENGRIIKISKKSINKLGFIYYHNLDKRIIKHRDIGFRYLKDKIPKIDWTITSDTKTIGGFTCIKAKGHFRGREYTAWYTMTVPVPFGPWKLQGLPGLILEAYDTLKEVYFYFKSIEYPSKRVVNIKIPNPQWDNKKWITIETYKEELLNAFNLAIENGRLFNEQSSISVIEELKSKMRNTYLEVFDEDQ